jgi:hypothetical protein
MSKITDEQKIAFLKEYGFRKIWYQDKSGFWLEKNFKINNFKAKFYYDGRFHHIEIETLNHKHNDIYEKQYEIIWKGSWNQFINKITKL